MSTNVQDFYIEGMVCLAMSKTPGVLDHSPRRTVMLVLANRRIYDGLMQRLRAKPA